MKKIFLLCFALLVSVMSFSQPTVRWEELASNERQIIEVDFSSIKRIDGSVFVWERVIYLDREYYINDMLADMRRIDASGVFAERATWGRWTHTVSYCEYRDETMIPYSIAHYNDDGTVIAKVDLPENKRTATSIVPDTLMAQTYTLLKSTFIFEVDGRKYTMNIEDIDAFTGLNPSAEYVGFY